MKNEKASEKGFDPTKLIELKTLLKTESDKELFCSVVKMPREPNDALKKAY